MQYVVECVEFAPEEQESGLTELGIELNDIFDAVENGEILRRFGFGIGGMLRVGIEVFLQAAFEIEIVFGLITQGGIAVNGHEWDEKFVEGIGAFQLCQQYFKYLFIAKGIEVTDDHIRVMLEGIFDVLDVHVVVGKVNNLAVILVFRGAVNAGDDLYGADSPDLLVEKQGVQFLFVKAGLQFGNHNHQTVFIQSKTLQHLLFR